MEGSATQSNRLSSAEFIGDVYELKDCLGTGATGQVYAAFRRSIDSGLVQQLYAAKTVSEDYILAENGGREQK